MKRRRLPLVVLVALLLVSGGVMPGASAGPASTLPPGGVVQLNEANNNQSIAVDQGAVVELSLPSNRTTGYIWSYTGSPDQNVVTKTSYFYFHPSSLIGAGGEEHWVFQAVGTGTTSLSLSYARPWEKGQPAQTYSVEIGVNSSPASATLRWSHASFTIGGNAYSVNGQVYQMDDSPILQDGRVYVPVRNLIAALGLSSADIYWDTASRSVLLPPNQDGIVYHLKIGDTNIYRIDAEGTDSVVQAMDAAPLNLDGRVYLPARFIAGLFGYQAGWDAAAHSLSIEPGQN